MILLLPTAHGRGHLKRMAVLARALAASGADVAGPASLARVHEEEYGRALRAVETPPLDCGALLWDGRLDAARAHADARVAAWRDALARLRPRLVVADADPWPLQAAAALGLPRVLVSNFTWADFADEAWLVEAYRGAAACELPFSLGLRGVGGPRTRVPHLADPVEAAPAPAPTALYALGKGNPAAPAVLRATEPVTLQVPRDADAPRVEGPVEIVRFDGPPSRLVPSAHVVIAKGSYATVTEAMAARRPLAIVPRPGGVEDAVIARDLAAAGVARVAEEGMLTLPTAEEARAMAAAYARLGPEARCDPLAVADAVLRYS